MVKRVCGLFRVSERVADVACYRVEDIFRFPELLEGVRWEFASDQQPRTKPRRTCEYNNRNEKRDSLCACKLHVSSRRILEIPDNGRMIAPGLHRGFVAISLLCDVRAMLESISQPNPNRG